MYNVTATMRGYANETVTVAVPPDGSGASVDFYMLPAGGTLPNLGLARRFGPFGVGVKGTGEARFLQASHPLQSLCSPPKWLLRLLSCRASRGSWSDGSMACLFTQWCHRIRLHSWLLVAHFETCLSPVGIVQRGRDGKAGPERCVPDGGAGGAAADAHRPPALLSAPASCCCSAAAASARNHEQDAPAVARESVGFFRE
jgi:hypothetical protein